MCKICDSIDHISDTTTFQKVYNFKENINYVMGLITYWYSSSWKICESLKKLNVSIILTVFKILCNHLIII